MRNIWRTYRNQDISERINSFSQNEKDRKEIVIYFFSVFFVCRINHQLMSSTGGYLHLRYNIKKEASDK